jgi:hypothetical protein
MFLLTTVQVFGQNDAKIDLPNGVVNAGDPVEFRLTLREPAPCNTQVQLFYSENAQNVPGTYFVASGDAKQGSTSVVAKAETAKDQAGGEYKISYVRLLACPGYSKITMLNPTSPPTVTIIPLPDPHVYPSSADISLSLSQKQFLDTKSEDLDDLIGRIDTKLQGHAMDSQGLRSFLSDIVSLARNDLLETESQYRKNILKPHGTMPAFFADFAYRYDALEADLKAPPPGMAFVAPSGAVTLIAVQLEHRKGNGSDLPENLGTTLSTDVIATRDTLKDNRAAYQRAKDGMLTFEARIISHPDGARISYKKLIDADFRDYSSPTDVQSATFELATWIFVFHLEGCSDVPSRRIDPYDDPRPRISVEFNHCDAKRR